MGNLIKKQEYLTNLSLKILNNVRKLKINLTIKSITVN